MGETETAQQKRNIVPHSAIQEKRHTILTPKKLHSTSTFKHETKALLTEAAVLWLVQAAAQQYPITLYSIDTCFWPWIQSLFLPHLKVDVRARCTCLTLPAHALQSVTCVNARFYRAGLDRSMCGAFVIRVWLWCMVLTVVVGFRLPVQCGHLSILQMLL